MPSLAAPADAPTPDPTTPGGSGVIGPAGEPPPAGAGAEAGGPAAGATAAAARGTSDPNGGRGPTGADANPPAPPALPTDPAVKGAAPAIGGADAWDTAGAPAAAATGAGPEETPPAGT